VVTKASSRGAAAADGATDGLLVLIGGGRVDEPVADFERGDDGLLGALREDLEDAEAEDGHLDAVVQGDVRNCRLHGLE
jgi:hypothetical protein